MVNDVQLSLCEPSYPQTLVKYHIEDGELKHTETTVYGPKIPLLELRERLLKKHEPYMYLHTDNQLSGIMKSTSSLKCSYFVM